MTARTGCASRSESSTKPQAELRASQGGLLVQAAPARDRESKPFPRQAFRRPRPDYETQRLVKPNYRRSSRSRGSMSSRIPSLMRSVSAWRSLMRPRASAFGSPSTPFRSSQRDSAWDWGVAEVRRLKVLEEENRKLRKLVADLSLGKQMLQDVLRKKP